MSSRKKYITARLIIETPNKTAHVPPGDYDVAIRNTRIEEGNVKAEIVILGIHKPYVQNLNKGE